MKGMVKMSKIIELRTAMKTFLKSIHPQVYFEIPSDKATFPYLIYDLPNSLTIDESTETFVLEIDGWDTPADQDTTALEMLMDSVDKGLQGKVVLISGMAFKFHRENRFSLRDDDKRIRRRKYVYEIRTFSGGE
jgi:hypothetical protein